MENTTAPVKSQRILGLDAVRTVAIIYVTIFHMNVEILQGSFFGVPMFFVLTGWLLAFTSERARLAGKFSVLNYYWKRIKRIYPSLIIVVLASVGAFYLLAPKVIEAIRPEVISILLGYNNLWQIDQNADYFQKFNDVSPFTHMWFIGIELQYYLCWPVLFMIYVGLAKIGWRKLGIFLMTILAVGAATIMPQMYQPGIDISRLYYGTDTRIYELLFGAVAGLIFAGRTSEEPNGSFVKFLKYTLFFACVAVIAYASVTIDGQNPLVYQGGMAAMSAVICLTISLIADGKISIGKALENPLFRWVGKYSFGIFLWQYPIIVLFHQMGWDKLPNFYAIELAAIILLSIWSESVSDALLKFKLPARGESLVFLQKASFVAITFAGVVVMGYGCNGIIDSADTKASNSALQARLEANKAKNDAQNKKSAAMQENPAPVEKNTQENFETEQPVKKDVDLSGVTCIGDSIMLASAEELHDVLPNCYVDAAVSRHIEGGIEAAQTSKFDGTLGKIVVLGLGTNGSTGPLSLYHDRMLEMLDCLGNDRQIFWVNIFYPQSSQYYDFQFTNNQYIKEFVAERKNIHEVDWNGLISKHPEWLIEDGIHPTEKGSEAYAQLIHDTIVEELSKQP